MHILARAFSAMYTELGLLIEPSRIPHIRHGNSGPGQDYIFKGGPTHINRLQDFHLYRPHNLTLPSFVAWVVLPRHSSKAWRMA